MNYFWISLSFSWQVDWAFITKLQTTLRILWKRHKICSLRGKSDIWYEMKKVNQYLEVRGNRWRKPGSDIQVVLVEQHKHSLQIGKRSPSPSASRLAVWYSAAALLKVISDFISSRLDYHLSRYQNPSEQNSQAQPLIQNTLLQQNPL